MTQAGKEEEMIARDCFDALGPSGQLYHIKGALEDAFGIISYVAPMRLDIITLTGGGATALDGIPTTNLTTPHAIFLILPNEPLSCYQLEAGTTAESVPNIIHPDDFHAVTNAKIWVKKL
jgi:hypothetical protein